MIPPLLYHNNATKAVEAAAGEAPPAAAEVAAVTTEQWLLSPLVGISQIFVVNSALSGAIILAGIAVYSREAAAHTLLGSSIGCATGVIMGADPAAICDGLWGFNPALTSLAISVFFTPTVGMHALSVGGAGASTVLASGMGPAFGVLGAPAGTLPFCLTAAACYKLNVRCPSPNRTAAIFSLTVWHLILSDRLFGCFVQESLPSVVPALNPHSPEVNRRDTAAALAAAAEKLPAEGKEE